MYINMKLDYNKVQKSMNSWFNVRNSTLLELSFKLKQAHASVFGKHRVKCFSELEQIDGKHKCNYDIFNDDHLDSDSDDSDHLLANLNEKPIFEINEIYRKYDACFPRIIIENNDYPINHIYKDNNKMDSDIEMDESGTSESKKHNCNFCNYTTNSKSHLIRHQRAMHPTYDNSINNCDSDIQGNLKTIHVINRKFKCDMCQYQTDCKSHLRRHVGSVHSKEKPYQCQHCSVEFSRSEKIKEHHNIYHSDKYFDLKKSRKWFSMNSEVNKSVTSANNRISKIKMLYDDADIDVNKEELDKIKKPIINMDSSENTEVKGKKKKIKKLKKTLRCLKCDYTCRDLWHLKRHILEIHTTQKDNNCKVCQYASNRVHILISHMRGHGELFCIHCDFSSINEKIFTKHFQLCSAIKKSRQIIQCKLCDFKGEKVENLLVHSKENHINDIFFCQECPYMTDNFLELKNHSPLHNFHEIICLICNEIFETLESKNNHDKNHFMEISDKFICKNCTFQGDNIFEIKAHLLSHITEKIHCGIEDCSFKCNGNLAYTHHKKFYHKDLTKISSDISIDQNKDFEHEFNQIEYQESILLNLYNKKSPHPTEYNKVIVENQTPNDEENKIDEWKCVNKGLNSTEPKSNNEPLKIKPLRLYKNSEKINNLKVQDDENMILKLDLDFSRKRKISAVTKYGDYELESPILNHQQQQQQPTSNFQINFDNLPASGIFNCPHCFERPPFRYRKSFEKHMFTHNV